MEMTCVVRDGEDELFRNDWVSHCRGGLILEDNVAGLCVSIMYRDASCDITKYVQCVDDTRDPSQTGQQDVDEQVRTAATLEEDADWWQENGEEHLTDVAGSKVSMLCRRVDQCATASTATYDPVKGMLVVVGGFI